MHITRPFGFSLLLLVAGFIHQYVLEKEGFFFRQPDDILHERNVHFPQLRPALNPGPDTTNADSIPGRDQARGPDTPCADHSACQTTFAMTLGAITGNARGYTLAFSETNKVIYLGGVLRDSVSISAVCPDGHISWTRCFDMVPGRADHLHGLIEDSDGMLVGTGVGVAGGSSGELFVFRYNPSADQMMWANRYASTGINEALAVIELFPGGDFLVSANPQQPANNAELFRLDRQTGAVDPSFAAHYNLGSSETIYDMQVSQGKVFGAARFTDGPSTAQMRTALLRVDASGGQVEQAWLGHRPRNASARLYGVDLALAQGGIYMLTLGDEDATSIDQTEIFIHCFNTDGDHQWTRQYDLPGTNDWADELVLAPDGLIVMGRNRVPPSDIYLFKINFGGDVVWGRRFDFGDNDNSVYIGGLQAQMLLTGDAIWFTASTELGGRPYMLLVKTNERGEVADPCASTYPLDVPTRVVSGASFYSPGIQVIPFVPQRIALAPAAPAASKLNEVFVCQETGPTSVISHISICAGRSYMGHTDPGIYLDTLPGSDDQCDTVLELHLDVLATSITAFDTVACPGLPVYGYTMPGLYTDTLVSAEGCDSIRIIHLIHARPEVERAYSGCKGETFMGWPVPGIYLDTVPGMAGACDTILRLILQEIAVPETTVHVGLCHGEQYDGYSVPGMYTDTLLASTGCDSVRHLVISVIGPLLDTVVTTSCERAANGRPPGLYVDTLRSVQGCDSLRFLQVQDWNYYIPNVFSPNGDGLNDAFMILTDQGENVEGLECEIFDRWGNMLYRTVRVPIRWDGRDKDGRPLGPGEYTFRLILPCPDGQAIQHGTVTLLR